MGLLSLPGSSYKASNPAVLNMTLSEVILKKNLEDLNRHGIQDPQKAIQFMLAVIETDKQTISAEFQSLREDSLDDPISKIETAAGIYNRESVSDQERRTELKSAIDMMLEPAVRTLLRRTQRYVGKVIEIDQTPRVKRVTSAFRQLSKQVDSYSFCARICFEGAVAGMTYARAIDAELGGSYTKSLIETFNECINSLTDNSGRCLIMSEYAANEDLADFWLEIPKASTQMINSGDWNSLAQIAEKSTYTQIAPAPPPHAAPVQIVVKKAKPRLFSRLKKWLSGFVRRLVFLFTGKPFEEQNPQAPVNTSPSNMPGPSALSNTESVPVESDYENILFKNEEDYYD